MYSVSFEKHMIAFFEERLFNIYIIIYLIFNLIFLFFGLLSVCSVLAL